MDPSQRLQQLSTKLSEFAQDKRKVVILAGVILGLMVIGLAFSALSPRSSNIANQNGTAQVTPEPTKTVEEIAALTLAPPKPTDIQFITKEDLIEHPLTPTPTPLPGAFYIANGAQNDLLIKLVHVNRGDTFSETRLINQKTGEQRLLGYIYDLSPGDSAFFSSDFSQVIFLGGSKAEYQKVNVYSIEENKIVKSLTLDQMKEILPALKTDTTSVLSSMMPSPDKTKVALSYGLTFNTTPIHPETQILVINLINNKMRILPVNGLVKQWKDATTLEYDVAVNNTKTRETRSVTVPGI